MIRIVLAATVASAALAVAVPALAGPGGHGGGLGGAGANVGVGAGANINAGPSQAGIDARVNSQSSINASPNAIGRASSNSVLNGNTTTTPRAINSQGLLHASPNAIGRANANSVLGRGAVSSTSLPGLTTGLTVQNSTGTTLGTVSRVVTGTDGSVRLLIVTSPTGQTLRLAPSTLSISGGVVTTTTGG